MTCPCGGNIFLNHKDLPSAWDPSSGIFIQKSYWFLKANIPKRWSVWRSRELRSGIHDHKCECDTNQPTTARSDRIPRDADVGGRGRFPRTSFVHLFLHELHRAESSHNWKHIEWLIYLRISSIPRRKALALSAVTCLGSDREIQAYVDALRRWPKVGELWTKSPNFVSLSSEFTSDARRLPQYLRWKWAVQERLLLLFEFFTIDIS